ncbi:MAG: chemotaxis protein CheW [Desulfamplus sp.]|nr:chemotaxis protein CheW [Desulfamplus sp.]
MSGVAENLKILLVEDDRTMRQIEIHVLKKIGYTDVIQAANGDEAIQILQQEQDINIIISDWNMPKKGGLELLKWVRADKKLNSIPFIMATGQADKKHEKQAVDAGVTGFLVKPFADDELKLAIRKAFGIDTEEFKWVESLSRMTPSGKLRLKIAHIQITDHLVLGVLKHLLDKGELKANHFELETICMSGWNPVAKSLENGIIDGACILAPLAMDLYSVGTPIKLVLLSHKNGSIAVRTKNKKYDKPFKDFFEHGSFLIPHKMSIHHMLSHIFLKQIGLNPSMQKGSVYDVEFEVAPPINMPEFLKTNTNHSGFMVAEPIGSLAVESNIASYQFLSGEIWENHPCCAVVMQKEFIDNYTDAMFEFTRLLVKAGKFIATHLDDAAKIAVEFLDPDRTIGLTVPILKKVLTDPNGITTDDLYPVVADLDTMQQYMVKEMGIGNAINIDEFVDLRFADNSCDMGLADFRPSFLHSSKEEILTILNKNFQDNDKTDDFVDNVVEHVDSMSNNLNQEHIEPMTNNIKQLDNGYGSSLDRNPVEQNLIQNSNIKEELNSAQEGKYLTFFLDREEYGITIRNIREIIGMMAITHVPRTPSYVKGVINLRGKVIPVMDIRIKFGMESIEYNDRTCILVVEVPSGRENHNVQIGVIVDSVSEVLNVRSDDIEANPKFGVSLDTDAILGMAKIGERVRILLDIEKALSVEM